MEIRKSVPVIPELPKVLGNEQIHVYAPLASTTAHGIAQFSAEFFEVTAGLVKIAESLIKKLEYVRKSIDKSSSDELDENGENPQIVEAGFDNLAGAVGSLHNDVMTCYDGLRSLEEDLHSVIDSIADCEIRLTNAEDDIDDNSANIGTLDLALERHGIAAEKNFKDHEGRITDNANDIESIRETEIGDMSVFNNSSVATMLLHLKDVGLINANDIANLNAKVAGVARSFVVRNFEIFKNYINGVGYDILPFLSDLKNGDNVYITESSVPDFWFEINANPAAEDIEVIEYDGELVELVAKDALGDTVGIFHSLETKYIEGEQLPEVDADDEGKFLRVADGKWKAAYVPRAEEATF